MGAFCLDGWRCPALQTPRNLLSKGDGKNAARRAMSTPSGCTVEAGGRSADFARHARAHTIRPEAEKPPPASTLSPFVGPQVAHRRWRMRPAAAFQKSLAAFAMLQRSHANFTYQAGSWPKPRRVVAKVEWDPGELYPRVGFIVTNMARPADNVVAFYNKRGTCETLDQGGQGRDPMDTAILSLLRR